MIMYAIGGKTSSLTLILQIRIRLAMLVLACPGAHAALVSTVPQLFMEGQLFSKKMGDFGTKICYFIRKNMAENGLLVFHTVLYSNYDEKLVNHERKTLR